MTRFLTSMLARLVASTLVTTWQRQNNSTSALFVEHGLALLNGPLWFRYTQALLKITVFAASISFEFVPEW